MTELLRHYARVTPRGKTVAEMQFIATSEFAKLFEGQTFTMTVIGNAEPDCVFPATGEVYMWKQEYEASTG